MLKQLRKKKFAKKIFILLAIIIVPAFIFWGSATAIKDRQSRGYAGKIFGKKISYEEYKTALLAWRNQLKMKFGDQAGQVENIVDSNKAVWDRLILLYETKRRRITVNNDELTAYITSFPFLQKDGIFDSGLYELFLRYSLNTPPRIFEEETRETIKFEKLAEQVTDDLKVSDEEVKARYKKEHQQIKAKYISVLFKDFEGEIKLSEDNINDYYEKHKQDLKIPIQINLNYMGIDYPKDATDAQKEDINKKIKELKAFLREGNDLTKAKDKFGLKSQETGFFSLGDNFPGFEWLPENFAKIFNLGENQISDIIKTPKGPYIFQLKEKRLDYVPPFDRVKEIIKLNFTLEKSRELAKNKMDNLYPQIKAKKDTDANLDLEKIAAALSLPLKETDFFTALADMGFSKEFNNAAFDLADGQISQPIETTQGYFVLEVSERKPIDENEFQKEKEDLKKNLLAEKKDKAFEEFVINLKAKANLVDYISTELTKKPFPKSF